MVKNNILPNPESMFIHGYGQKLNVEYQWTNHTIYILVGNYILIFGVITILA